MASPSSRPTKKPRKRRTASFFKLMLFGLAAAILALVVAVLVAMASLPGFRPMTSCRR
jgi:hypothetical protein